MFETSRNIHTVAEYIVTLDDDITQVYANPNLDPVFLSFCLFFRKLTLDAKRGPDRIDDTAELDQSSVSSPLHDPSAMFDNCWFGNLVAQRLDASKGAFFVLSHKTGVADNVGGHDCS